MTIRPDDLPEWRDADRISDRIIALASEETKRGVSPLQVLAGVMLALVGILKSAPEDRPAEMKAVEATCRICLLSMLEAKRSEN